MNRAELQKLARMRIRDAKVLLTGGRYEGAYYLAGYAVECALKACIAKQTKRYDFPNKERAVKCWVHDLEKLLELAGLAPQRNSASAELQANWAVVKDWDEEVRYLCTKTDRDANDLYSAITQRGDGVLTWLKNLW